MEIDSKQISELVELFGNISNMTSKLNDVLKKVTDEEIKKQPKSEQAKLRKQFDTSEIDNKLMELKMLNKDLINK